uniref:5-deoxy-glucuronate isomerase (EC) n=1 Tax=uncultured Thiotrichaceae bacterium TaxID=298394 RepID=A0A6S6T1X8_9GAMM|nr:MAG: 5-deoxy-glucuronate isomerase (EC [uncultured Thiotrichaceae bacterium]
MNLLCRPVPSENGRYQHITPENAGWQHVGFEAYDLKQGDTLELGGSDNELCLVLLSGKADVKTSAAEFSNIGDRMDVFEDKAPHAVYVKNGEDVTVTANTNIELAVCAAPGHGNHETRYIKPDEMGRELRGEGTNTRHICNILPDDEPADSLLVVEVKTPSGNWSSYPPHKHDSDNIPYESYLEETYYHRIKPSQGFVFQRVFTDELDIDETMSVSDKEVVMVPRGYHPVGVPHGYDSYYLNVMAGPTRTWIFKNHPDHEWMLK